MLFAPVERVGGRAGVPPWLRHQHVERYRWAARFVAGRRVLDAACGSGYGAGLLLRGGAREVVGVDLSAGTIDRCRARCRSAHVRYVVGDVTALPLPDRSCDVYLSFETIEHVGDDARFVAEARRVLAPGGVFVCSTPNRRVTNPGTGIGDRPFNPFHLREYTADELRGRLARGFGVVELFGQTPFAGAYVRLLQRVGRVWRGAAVRLHQLRKVAGVPFDRPGRHAPGPLGGPGEPEVLVAVCR